MKIKDIIIAVLGVVSAFLLVVLLVTSNNSANSYAEQQTQLSLQKDQIGVLSDDVKFYQDGTDSCFWSTYYILKAWTASDEGRYVESSRLLNNASTYVDTCSNVHGELTGKSDDV